MLLNLVSVIISLVLSISESDSGLVELSWINNLERVYCCFDVMRIRFRCLSTTLPGTFPERGNRNRVFLCANSKVCWIKDVVVPEQKRVVTFLCSYE